MKLLKVLSITAAFFIIQLNLMGSEKVTQVELILDASRSMRNRIGDERKIDIAKKSLLGMLDNIKARKEIHVGLRVFGHKNKLCRNTILETGIGDTSESSIRSVVKSVNPIGNTPIAYSLIKASADFDAKKAGDKIIILVTDGNETCGDNPCLVAEKLKKQGIISKIHIVGLGLSKDYLGKLNCIVKPSGGVIINADDPEKMKKTLLSLLVEGSDAVNLKKRVIQKNLVVTAIDKNGRKVFINIDVKKNNRLISSGEGEIVAFSLQPGDYQLRVKSDTMNISYTLNKVKVTKENVTRKELNFGESLLIINARDITNRHVDTEIEISKPGTGEIVKKIERVEVTVDDLLLAPGIYNLKITDIETGFVLNVNNFTINPGTNSRDIIFNRGTVDVSGRSSTGNEKFTAAYVYIAGTGRLMKKSTGIRKHKFVLLPGLYDIKIKDWYGKGEQLLKNIEVMNGKISVKTVVID